MWIDARTKKIESREIVPKDVGSETFEVNVLFLKGGTVYPNLFIDQADAVTGNSNHALDEVLGRVDWVMEHNDVAALDVAIRDESARIAATAEMQLIHKEVIPNQQSFLHGFGRDLEGLDGEGDDEDRDYYGGDERLDGFQ